MPRITLAAHLVKRNVIDGAYYNYIAYLSCHVYKIKLPPFPLLVPVPNRVNIAVFYRFLPVGGVQDSKFFFSHQPSKLAVRFGR